MLRTPKASSAPLVSLALALLKPLPFSSVPRIKTSKSLAPRRPEAPKSKNSTKLKSILPVPTNPDVGPICSLLSEPSDRPRDLDDLLKDYKPKITSDLILETLRHYRQFGRSKTLEFFSWASLQLEFRLDDPLVEYMADFLGRRKLFDDLKSLLKTVSSHKGRVSSRAVSISIRFLGRQGRVVEALALFEMMEVELNCPPDNLVVNNVLYVLCKKDSSGNSVGIAFRIFSRIRHPDTFSYSNMIIGLCRFGRLEDALEMFEKMGRAHLAPTRTAANVLIGKLCELGGETELVGKVRVESSRKPFDILVPNMGATSRVEAAVEVFWAASKLGLTPSAHVVSRLISGLCRLGEIDTAVDILKLLESRNPRSADESYSTLIRALSEARRMDEACDLFGRMLHQGLKPKLVVYNSVIRAFCKLGVVEEAQKCYEFMNKSRCEPDCATHTMLIHAHCRVHNWEAAYGLLIEMIEFGWCPHFDTYNLVDTLLNENGRTDLLLQLERKMDVRNLQAYCRAGRLEAAYDSLNSMLAKGFNPPIYVRDAFERAFQRSGKWKVAQELLKKMDQSVIQNNAQAYTNKVQISLGSHVSFNFK